LQLLRFVTNYCERPSFGFPKRFDLFATPKTQFMMHITIVETTLLIPHNLDNKTEGAQHKILLSQQSHGIFALGRGSSAETQAGR
jgi:hypothetical protein